MGLYTLIYLEKLSFTLLLFAAFVTIIRGFFAYDLIEQLNDFSLKGLNMFVYTLILISLVYNIQRRDFYLPFLGKTAYPCNALSIKQPKNATISVKLTHLTPNANIVYWASEKGHKNENEIVDSPWEAYDQNKNSGVTISNSEGIAIAKIRPPIGYKIPSGMKIKKHLHYRECIGKGMLGKINTKYLE